MTDPVFSIIVPTHNRADLLPRALQSVLKQTFTDFECIIVDDGGDLDLSPQIAQLNDERLVLIRHQRNKGVAAAYNTGIKASRGAFISILDDDDEYYPMLLEKMNRLFQSAPSRIGFAWAGVRKVMDTPNGEILLHERMWPAEFQQKETAFIAATTIGNGFGLTMKRKCFDTVGFYNESFKMCEDTEHLFRLVRRFAFATIPEILVKLHQHDYDRLTHVGKDDIRLSLYERILVENADIILNFPELHYIHYRRLAEICYSIKRNQKGRQILLKLWKKFPSRISIPLNLYCYTAFGTDFRTVLHKTEFGKIIQSHSIITMLERRLTRQTDRGKVG